MEEVPQMSQQIEVPFFQCFKSIKINSMFTDKEISSDRCSVREEVREDMSCCGSNIKCKLRSDQFYFIVTRSRYGIQILRSKLHFKF
jgi:hypothetical protein